MEVLLYILSISLQVAGALLLMLFSLSTKRKQVVERFANKNLIIKDSKENLQYDIKTLKYTFKTAYLSKFSFGYIALGYLFGIYGSTKGASLLFITIYVIICTILLMLTAYILTSFILKHSKNAKQPLTEAEMVQYGLEPNIEFMSEKDFENMWNET